jgi:hypothetical protein
MEKTRPRILGLVENNKVAIKVYSNWEDIGKTLKQEKIALTIFQIRDDFV